MQRDACCRTQWGACREVLRALEEHLMRVCSTADFRGRMVECKMPYIPVNCPESGTEVWRSLDEYRDSPGRSDELVALNAA
jgi:hypothetical protein